MLLRDGGADSASPLASKNGQLQPTDLWIGWSLPGPSTSPAIQEATAPPYEAWPRRRGNTP